MITKPILTPDDVAKIMTMVTDPTDTIIAHFVPTRAFRVVARKGDMTFRVEQLSRQAGDKWVALSTHQDDEPWKAFGAAWNDAADKQKNFLIEMRKLKVAQNQKLRAAQ